ncbi:MAG: ATP-binding cassette domain-containing protein, partial [Propionibacteriaceae bacterium]|nr:ATP-binding cassette domain-containing protein [Propionibacteriaceae bacterium]
PGALIVVSHDVPLLDAMTSTVELHDHKIDVFGGPYSEWLQARETEQVAAVQAEKAAEFQVRLATRQRAATLERTARNLARGKQKAINEGIGRAGRDKMCNTRNTAEKGAGRARGVADERVAAARQKLDEASQRVRIEEHIRIALPDPQVHASKTILELTWSGGQFVMQGPERVALTGRNGVGKTTLIERLLGRRPDVSIAPGIDGHLLVDRVGYLPQRLDLLDDAASPIDNVMASAPSAKQAVVRAQLARLLIRGDAVFRLVGNLSGGERFRVALARLLLATPPAQLLILDEPTNNLDIASVQHLVEAFASYRGAVLVVSHDDRFLARLGVTTRLELVAEGDGRPGLMATTVRRSDT